MRHTEPGIWPDCSDARLAATAEDWLAPVLLGKTALTELSERELMAALIAQLPVPLQHRLNAEAPSNLVLTSGARVPINYAAAAGPTLSVRLQELFGTNHHPNIVAGRVPLILELLSPALRPIAVTGDLPGFWARSYRAVKAEMKGRYPRHFWPDDPAAPPPARAPTRRRK
jgi:ATP-dependent helicase HrpB